MPPAAGGARGALIAVSLRMRLPQLVCIGALLFAALPSPAQAQADPEFIKGNLTKLVRKIGVHVNGSARNFDGDVTKPNHISASVVLGGSRKEGWKFPVSLTTFSADLRSPSGTQFGTLKSWAVVGGVGYGWNFGRLSTGAGIEAGVAFNSGRLDDNAAQAFATVMPVSLDVGNALLLRPRLRAEYFLTRQFTLHTSAGYVVTRPNVSVTTAAGQLAGRWNASHSYASVGIGFYPFRKD